LELQRNRVLSSTNIAAVDFNLDELLNCSDSELENSVFFQSSNSLLNIINNSIQAIDRKLAIKHQVKTQKTSRNTVLAQ
jgi:hypothetical protein